MKKIIVTVYTTVGDKSFSMAGDQVLELAKLLQTEKEAVPLYTENEQLYAVGMLIQGRTFTKYPRIIAVSGEKGEQ